MSDRKCYPSDLSDERWALIEPVLTAWKARHPSASGHQGGYDLREVVNAILYQSRMGCQWEYLPHDLPPRSAAYYYLTWAIFRLGRMKLRADLLVQSSRELKLRTSRGLAGISS